MKKILAVFCCLAVIGACVLATGCGTDMSDSKYLGKWTATTGEYSGIKMGVEDILGGEFSFTLNADGTVDLKVIDQEESGKWSETDNGIQIEGDEELTFQDVDGTLVLDYSGVKLTFETD